MLSSEFFPRLDFRSHFCRHPSSDYLAKNISPLINNGRSKYQMNTVMSARIMCHISIFTNSKFMLSFHFCDIELIAFLYFRMNMHFHNFSKKKSPKSFKVHQSYPALNDVTEKQIMVCYF